jgi:ribosomal protein L37E
MKFTTAACLRCGHRLSNGRRVLCASCALAEWREQTSVPDRTHREAQSYAEAWNQATVAFMGALSVAIAARMPASRPRPSVFPPPDVDALEAEVLRLANELRSFADNDPTADRDA